MLNEAGVPRGRTWVHPPASAGSLAGTVLVAVASSLATLTAMLLLLPGLGRGVAAPHSGGTPSEAFAPAWSEPPLEVAEVFRRSAPAVVNVSVLRGRSGAGNGSGFVVRPDGLILTNHHVVADASRVTVRLQDGSELEAEILGRDAATDLALLRVPAAAPLPVLPLAAPEQLAVGDRVLTIGSPFGFDQSLSAGYVSALGRSLEDRDVWGSVIDGVIQTDAAINPGSSGGPLLNAWGEVVGVTTAIYSTGSGFQGIGFAIPVAVVAGVLPDLIDRGYVIRPWLGASGVNVTRRLATMLSLPTHAGVLVQRVADGSPAEQAGLVAGRGTLPFAEGAGLTFGGDIIVAVDGQPVGSVAELSRALGQHAVGDALVLTVLRGGRRMALRGILAEAPRP